MSWQTCCWLFWEATTINLCDLDRIDAAGAKHNLQFPARLRQQLEAECGFTDEELEILRCRARGMSILQTSFRMEELTGEYYPDRRVERRIHSIKAKIADVAKRLKESG